MGDDNKEQQGNVTPRREQVYDLSGARSNVAFDQPSNAETRTGTLTNDMADAYRWSAPTQTADYGNIMGGYRDWRSNVANPLMQSISQRPAHQFSYQTINPQRSADTGYAMQGYKNFADTGGYTPEDIQNLRARSMSPIRSAYGNTMMELDRSRALGGPGGSTNYIAALSRAQRELPSQLSDAMTNVNAGLAESIRSGKLQGLSGVTGISEAEAGRGMQAALANQQMDVKTQELTEQGYSAKDARQIAAAQLGLSGLEGERGLFGTAPGMSGMFGNLAMSGMGQGLQAEQQRNQLGLGLIDQQLRALGDQAPPGKPWWQTGMELAGSFVPFFSGSGGAGRVNDFAPDISTDAGMSNAMGIGGF